MAWMACRARGGSRDTVLAANTRRREGFQPEGEQRGGEVFGVQGDDGAGTGDDGCGEDVFVVGVGQSVGAVEAFPPGDLGVVERLPHLLDQVGGSPVGVGGVDTAVDQFGGLLVFELGEDDVAPLAGTGLRRPGTAGRRVAGWARARRCPAAR